MEIDKKTVERVAKVSRLHLSSNEIEEFVPQFEDILKFFSSIDSVHIDNDKGKIKLNDKFREDNVETCLDKSGIFMNTKNKKNSYFMGPKIK